MTTHELRLGNLISVRNSIKKVTAIFETSISAIDDETKMIGDGNINLIEGIPLTEELFNSLGLDPNFWSRLGEKTIGYRDNNPSDFIEFPCEYLHQFQNIYYCLFGTELNTKP